MPTSASPLLSIITREVRRRMVEESIPRIIKCMASVSSEELWHRPNEQTVSMGNLVLHLIGNVRQWLIAGMGTLPYQRNRDMEFTSTEAISHMDLAIQLEALGRDIEDTLNQLTEADLSRSYSVQGFEETGIAILMHVMEHFSYHTGQITYAVKSRKNLDMGYYAGQDLDQG